MSSASFPTSPAFNEQFIPAPVRLEQERLDDEEYLPEYLSKLDHYLSGQYLGLRNLQNSIASGWLISTLRVLDLDADTITANSVFLQDLYIGTDGNGGIRLGGTDSQIEITDDSGTTRFLAGDIGSDIWLQVMNSSGTVIFQSGSTTFIDGVILKNTSVADGAISDLAGNKLTGSGFIGESELAADAVTAGKINVSTLSAISADVGTLTAGTINATVAVNAGAISTGTLTASGSPVSIEITGSGALLCRSGGDIKMRHSGTGDDNLIEFQTSGGVWKGRFGYNSTEDVMYIRGASGTDISLEADLDINGQILSDLDPKTDSTYDIGSSGIKWSNVWSDFVNGADFCYENEIRTTEPNHVYTWADPNDGVLFMDQEWQPITWIHKDGRIETRNRVTELYKFPKSDIPRRERERKETNVH